MNTFVKKWIPDADGNVNEQLCELRNYETPWYTLVKSDPVQHVPFDLAFDTEKEALERVQLGLQERMDVTQRRLDDIEKEERYAREAEEEEIRSFKEVERIFKGKTILNQAFPVGLVLPDKHKEDTDAYMKTHLNDENFKGEIQGIYDDFIESLKA